MSKRERMYAVLVLVCIAVLAVKSLVVDPYVPADPGEIAFSGWVEEQQGEVYDGVLFNTHILVDRIVNIGVKEEDDQTLYVAKIRRYLVGVLPYKEMYIKEDVAKFQ